MQMPVARRDAAFLPILPARILFNGGPDFLRRQRNSLRKPLHCERNVDANQNAAKIENDGLNLRSRHSYLLSALRARRSPMIGGRMERRMIPPITRWRYLPIFGTLEPSR